MKQENKIKHIMTGNTAMNDILQEDEIIEPTVKKVDVEKLRIEIKKRDLNKKTKDQLISDLTDLTQLYNLTTKENIGLKKLLHQGLEELKNKTLTIDIVTTDLERKKYQIDKLNKELEIQRRVEQKMDEIFDKIIGSKK